MSGIGPTFAGWIRRNEAVGATAAGVAAKWAFLILLALLPVGLLSLFAFRTAGQAVSELVQANNLAAARGAADIVNEGILRSLRLDVSFAEAEEFVAAVEARDEEEVRADLRSVMMLYAPINRVSVHDVDGVLWSDFPEAPELQGRSFAGTEWYQGVSEDWEPYISSVFWREAEPRELVVAIAVPIHDKEDGVIGIFVSQYRLQRLGEGLRHVRVGETGSVFLLDPNGNVAAHPDLDMKGNLYTDFSELRFVRMALEGTPYTGDYRDPLTAEPKVATFLPVTIAGRNWVVVAEQPVADAYAPIRRIAWNIAGAAVILALAAVAVVIGLWRVSEHNRLLSLKLERRNKALQKTTDELERSNKELEEFAYVASHDLQEPLRMVASYTQLLERRYKGKLDESADKFIYYAVDGAKRMQSLIQDLLKYSRVGTQGKPFEAVDFSKVLQQALANLKLAIREENAEVTADPLPTLMADPTQMVQLFQNLIGNAIKFRGKEPPRIHVSAREEKGEWVFSIKDNGIGIDPAYFEKIFQIFQRLPGEKPIAGTGLGLSMCKKILERHEGRIWVESEKGQGATFHFTIPSERNTLK